MTLRSQLRLALLAAASLSLLALGCSAKQTATSTPEAPPATKSAAAEATGTSTARDFDPKRDLTEPPRRPDVHFVPTPELVVDKMLEIAKVTSDDLVYDLGCGDGRIVIAAARKYGARAIGYDIDPVRVAEARANVKEAGVEHLVTIEQADIFTLDLSPASVVTLYLLPRLNVKLIPQLEQLKPGSRIVSHDFDMEGVQHQQFLTMVVADQYDEDDMREHYIYYWETPLKHIRD